MEYHELSLYPKYEIWGIPHYHINDDYPQEEFYEDCFTMPEARKKIKEYHEIGDAAWLVNKDTRKRVQL